MRFRLLGAGVIALLGHVCLVHNFIYLVYMIKQNLHLKKRLDALKRGNHLGVKYVCYTEN